MADELTLTLRVHDSSEKKDASLSACWVVIKVDKADREMSASSFAEKYITPNLKQIANLKLT